MSLEEGVALAQQTQQDDARGPHVHSRRLIGVLEQDFRGPKSRSSSSGSHLIIPDGRREREREVLGGSDNLIKDTLTTANI